MEALRSVSSALSATLTEKAVSVARCRQPSGIFWDAVCPLRFVGRDGNGLGGCRCRGEASDAGSAFSVASGCAGFSGPVHDMFKASAAAANKYAYRFMFSVVNRLMPYDVPPDSSVYGP